MTHANIAKIAALLACFTAAPALAQQSDKMMTPAPAMTDKAMSDKAMMDKEMADKAMADKAMMDKAMMETAKPATAAPMMNDMKK